MAYYALLTLMTLPLLLGNASCFIGTNVDPRCYGKTCEISLVARDTAAAANGQFPVMERNLQSTVTACGAGIQQNVTMEVKQSHAGISGGIVQFAEGAIGTVNTVKEELMLMVEQVCSAGFQLSEVKSIHVELDILSGVENPKWTLLPSDANFTSVKEELAWTSSSQIPTRAGYRGFIVRTEMTDGTITLKNFGQGLQNSTALEVLLLQSYADNLDPYLVTVAIYGINGQVPQNLPTPGALTPYTSSDPGSDCTSVTCLASVYDPAPWSTVLSQQSNSCYNYASDVASSTWAQPGRGSGNQYDNISGETIRNSAVNDGFEDINDTAAGIFPDTNSCLVALVAIENLDFHFYRRDSDGMWSHKIGAHAPTNLDNNGQIITDPRTASIGPYQFVRFLSFCRRHSNLHIN